MCVASRSFQYKPSSLSRECINLHHMLPRFFARTHIFSLQTKQQHTHIQTNVSVLCVASRFFQYKPSFSLPRPSNGLESSSARSLPEPPPDVTFSSLFCFLVDCVVREANRSDKSCSRRALGGGDAEAADIRVPQKTSASFSIRHDLPARCVAPHGADGEDRERLRPNVPCLFTCSSL